MRTVNVKIFNSNGKLIEEVNVPDEGWRPILNRSTFDQIEEVRLVKNSNAKIITGEVKLSNGNIHKFTSEKITTINPSYLKITVEGDEEEEYLEPDDERMRARDAADQMIAIFIEHLKI